MRSDFVLESVSSARQINLSPLNTSTSKHLFSFSRGSRFKLDPHYCDSIYDLPSYFQRTHSSANKSRSKLNSTHLSFKGEVTVPPPSDSTTQCCRSAPPSPCGGGSKSSIRRCPLRRRTTTPGLDDMKTQRRFPPAAATSSPNIKTQASRDSTRARPSASSRIVTYHLRSQCQPRPWTIQRGEPAQR
jgi:hypothetical protein